MYKEYHQNLHLNPKIKICIPVYITSFHSREHYLIQVNMTSTNHWTNFHQTAQEYVHVM